MPGGGGGRRGLRRAVGSGGTAEAAAPLYGLVRRGRRGAASLSGGGGGVAAGGARAEMFQEGCFFVLGGRGVNVEARQETDVGVFGNINTWYSVCAHVHIYTK